MKKNIILVGPILTRSGYGEQARFALRALRSREDLFNVYIKPITWGSTSWIVDDTPERRWIDETIERTVGFIQEGGRFDVSLQVTIPNEFQKIAERDIGYTAGIETTHCAPEWTAKCNQMDSVIVVSNHSKNVLTAARFEAVEEATGRPVVLENQAEINVVNYPVKQYEDLPKLELEIDTDFNFLTVAQMGPRKNLQTTVKAFVEEFKDENVGLVIKTNIAKNCLMDRNLCLTNIKNMVDQFSSADRKCKIYMLHGHMSDEEMHSLYQDSNISAMVAIPHGEGFGLPIFEAAYSGLPVVSLGWSGQCDFLYNRSIPPEAQFYEVAFDIGQVPPEAVWDGVILKESGWAYARPHSAREQMRACYEDITNKVEGSLALNSCSRATELKEQFSEQKMYELFVASLVDTKSEQDKQEEVENLLNDLL